MLERSGGWRKPDLNARAIDAIKKQPFWVSFDVSYPEAAVGTTGRAISRSLDHGWFGAQGHLQPEDGKGGRARHTAYLGSDAVGSSGILGLMDIIRDVRAEFTKAGASIGAVRANAGMRHVYYHPRDGWQIKDKEAEIQALAKEHGIELRSYSYQSNMRREPHLVELWYGNASADRLKAFDAALKAYAEKQKWPPAKSEVIEASK
jgi:hypothetical protein